MPQILKYSDRPRPSSSTVCFPSSRCRTRGILRRDSVWPTRRIGAGFLFGDGKTVIRAGYGIFYDGLFTSIADNSALSQPNAFGGTLGAQSGRGQADASTFPSITPTLNSTLLIQTIANNLHNPLTQQWNVNVQRELPLGLVLTLAYVGTRGEHLFTNQDFNPAIGFDASGNYIYTNPNFGEIRDSNKRRRFLVQLGTGRTGEENSQLSSARVLYLLEVPRRYIRRVLHDGR